MPNPNINPAEVTAPADVTKIQADVIEWNKIPAATKISKEHRMAFSDRFDVCIFNLRDENQYDSLLLKDGWVIKAENNVVFVINAIKDEDLGANAKLPGKELDSGALGAKMRKVRDAVWDSKTYGDLSKVKDLIVDANTGKISYKLL